MNPARKDDWEAHWEDFAASASRNPAQAYRHKLVLGQLAALGAGPAMRLLDVGCGQGDFMAMAETRWPGASICGFDMSRTGVEITKGKLPKCDAHVVNLFHPPDEVSRYRDWATHAVCSEVLEHLDDPEKFLSAVRGFLSPGATLILTVPGGPMSAYDRHIGHRQHFTRAKLDRFLLGAGFTPARTLRAGFPFFNLYRMTVIARGEQLVRDVRLSRQASASRLALMAMAAYGILFRFNLADFPAGWQIVAVARKP